MARGRVYTIFMDAVAVTATQDLFTIQAAAGVPLEIHAVNLSQKTLTAWEAKDVTFKYVPATAGLFDGDQCSQLPGSVTSGLAFYEPQAGATTDPFPSSYDGTLLMADASRGCIWAMHAGADGRPDPTDMA